MTSFKTIMIGSAGLALTLAAATPAAAQYYPQNNGGGIVGAIINSVTGGYGRYPQGNYGYGQVSQRQSVQQCAAAAEQRLNGGYSGQGYGGYNGNRYQQGYGQQGYGYQAQGGARVVGITSVERRGNGGLRVTGVASSGTIPPHDHPGQGYDNQGYNNQGYGGQGYGNQAYATQGADLRFTCKVNSRGQVTDVNVNRLQTAYGRGY